MEVENSVVIVNSVPHPVPTEQDNSNINRDNFPPGFVFGTGTSSYQVEGAAAIGGKSLSVWDEFTTRTPARIADGSNGNVAADMYTRFKEDLRTMKKMGFDAYRFSISWPRVLPGGRASSGINREGLDYYNDLIDTIIANGMEPYVTLFHWDLPDCLEKEYNGFLSKKIVADFREYAELCFWEFGDRVKWWTTLNEPWTYAVNGYVKGTFPPSEVTCPPERVLKKLPGHRSIQVQKFALPISRTYSDVKFDKSDPAKDPYTVGKNLLLSHAAAVDVYRKKFKIFQQGQIGIVNNSHWYVPLDENSPDDIAAARRAVDFMGGWFLEPVLYGRYPQNMIDFVSPENLPPFTQQESQLLKGSTDYVGLNYYTTNYVSHDPNPEGVGYDADQQVIFHTERDGVPIGGPSGSSWLVVVPWGIHDHLVFLKETFPGIPPIYICENGVSDANDFRLTAREACVDTTRLKYHQDHLANILKAMTESKVDVRAYFVWSWCDNFEWAEGYTARFGITYIDFINNLTRYPKHSAVWFAEFLKSRKEQLITSSKRQDENDNEETNVGKKRLRATVE